MSFNRRKFWGTIAILYAIFVIYIFAVHKLLIGWTTIEWMRIPNFTPFETIGKYIMYLYEGRMNLDIILENLFGYALAFSPFGVMLPMGFKKAENWKVVFLFLLVLSTLSEGLQFLFKTGVFDIDDIILAVTGGMLGFGIYCFTKRCIFKKL